MDNKTTPPAAPETKAAHGYISDKDRYLARLKRIEGQARGIHRMIDQDTYCIDILTQVSALTSALQNVALGLLDDHLKALRRRRRQNRRTRGRRKDHRGIKGDRPTRQILRRQPT